MNKNKVYKDILRKINGINIKKDFDLFLYNTYRIHAIAPIFIMVKNLGEILKLMDYIKDNNLEYVFIGNGSNLLICNTFNKIFIKFDNKYSNIVINHNLIQVPACCGFSQVINKCVENKLFGFEEGVGIPGTIGGAVYMNAGAKNFEIGKFVERVIGIESGKVKVYTNTDCKFGYRSSIFQSKDVVIWKVFFRLSKDQNYNSKLVMEECLKQRKLTQPIGENSAGSVFKNIGEIKVAKLIDEAGLKGFRIGGARVSEKHANFIVTNNATCEDVLNLIDYIKRVIKLKYNIELQTEVKII